MNVARMIARELSAAKLSAALSVLGVAVPVGVASGVWFAAARHEQGTSALVGDKERGTQAMLDAMGEDYRAIGGRMPPDLYLVSAASSRVAALAGESAGEPFSEEVFERVAGTTQAVFERVQPRVEGWGRVKGYDGRVLVSGLGPERVLSDSGQSVAAPAVADGFAHVGYEICAACTLSVGRRIVLGSRTFTVAECAAQQGSRGDVTVRVSLREAQEVLGLAGLLHSIGAVLHDPATRPDTVAARIRADSLGLKTMGFGVTARTRLRMQNAAGKVADDVASMEQSAHQVLLLNTHAMLSLLVLASAFCCAVWVSVVTFVNMHRRRVEMGVLAALGMPPSMVAALLVGRGLVVGVAGAAIGLGGACLAGGCPPSHTFGSMAAAGAAGTGVCVLVHLWAATTALRHDPALILTGTGV